MGQVCGGAKLADQSCGVPRSSSGQLILFQQDDVFDAEFGQMIGDRTADDAAPDHENFG
jgi:hypothetical protein